MLQNKRRLSLIVVVGCFGELRQRFARVFLFFFFFFALSRFRFLSGRLRGILRQSGATEVAYLPTIVVEPEKQLGFPPVKGMDVQRPSPGWNLVGVTVWKELRMALGDKYPEAVLWPDRVPPLERVGKGMLLYYFP